jgi:DNA polymerase-3 subunit delta'
MNEINRFKTLQAYQPQEARILQSGFINNRLSHAFIFEGPKGTHKLATAYLFAQRLLCTNVGKDDEPCGNCSNCVRISHGTHPNVFLVKADSEQIKKEQIKNLIIEFARLSVENGPRIYIVDEAERMNQDASNTLLKQMEEPSADIYAVLLTTNSNALLKTIVSRAQLIHFKPIARALIRENLLKEDVSELAARVIPEYTNNIEEAVKIARSKDLMAILDLVVDLYRIAGKKNQSMILRFKETSDRVMVNVATMDFFLTSMILFQKDLLYTLLQHHDQIVFTPEKALLEKLSKTTLQSTIQEMLEKMLALKSRLRYNLNYALAFDLIIAQLERGMQHGT